MKIIEAGIDNPVLVKLILLLVLAIGGASFLTLPRYMDPDVSTNYVVITTINPGMSPDDIENLIIQKIEDEVDDIDDVDRFVSVASESVAFTQVEFYQSVKNMDLKVTEVQNAVNRIDDFPENTERPRVFEISTSFFPICEIAFSSSLPEKTMTDIADRLADRIEDIDGVGVVDIFGDRDREIWIEVDKNRMEAYGLSLNDINLAVQSRNRNVPGGFLDEGRQRVSIRAIGEFDSPRQLENIALFSLPDGGTVYLRDVATVRDTFEDVNLKVKESGRSCFLLKVKRTKGSDTIRILDEIKALLPEFKNQIGQGINLTLFNDQSREIRGRLSDLQNNALLGLLFVYSILAYSLGWRNALFASLGIPVSFLVTFTVMNWGGMSLNGVSLFAMILVLGIVVDDAIIVLENIRRYMEMGVPRRQAALEGAKEVTLPVSAATFTTFAAFIPLLLVTGIIGKFIREIPLVVLFTLSASLIEAFFMMPCHVSVFGKLPRKCMNKASNKDIFTYLRPRLGRCLFYVLRHRYIVVPTLLLILAIASFASWKMLQVEMFPTNDIYPRFDVKIWLPDGSRVEETEAKLEEIRRIAAEALPENILKTTIEIAGWVEVEYRIERAPHVGTVELLFTEDYKNTASIPKLIEMLRPHLTQIQGLRSIQIDRIKEGPPTGEPVYLEVRGEEWERINGVANRLKDELKTTPGVYDVKDNFSRNRREIRLKLDEAKAKLLGVDHGMLANTVHTAFQGMEIAQFHDGDEELDIYVKLREEDRGTIEDVQRLQIKTRTGAFVHVKDVANIEIAPAFYFIYHTKGKRTVIVSAQIDSETTTSSTVNAQIKKKIPLFLDGYPECSINFSGEYKRTQETFDSIYVSFALGVFLIYFILGTQFKSFLQPLIIMTVVPFASVGVFGGLLMNGLHFTFPAMIGIVALAGIVVNDSLVLVEYVNRTRHQRTNIYDAIVRASKVRLRPIVLTSITTIGGLAPMAMGIGGESPLWQPLANSVIFGLTASTFLTLFIVPLVYAMLEDMRNLVSRIFRRAR